MKDFFIDLLIIILSIGITGLFIYAFFLWLSVQVGG